jgi:hypothetical protein
MCGGLRCTVAPLSRTESPQTPNVGGVPTRAAVVREDGFPGGWARPACLSIGCEWGVASPHPLSSLQPPTRAGDPRGLAQQPLNPGRRLTVRCCALPQEGADQAEGFSASLRVPTSMVNIGNSVSGGGGGSAVMEKQGLSTSQVFSESKAKVDDTGGGGNNGKNINNGGGGGDDDDDDDDYFDEDEEVRGRPSPPPAWQHPTPTSIDGKPGWCSTNHGSQTG